MSEHRKLYSTGLRIKFARFRMKMLVKVPAEVAAGQPGSGASVDHLSIRSSLELRPSLSWRAIQLSGSAFNDATLKGI